MVEKLIKELSKELNLESPPHPNDKGVYTLRFEPNIRVHISPYEQGYSFTADVIDCPKENQDSVFEKLLLGNLFGQGTSGCILGLNDEGTMVVLSFHRSEKTEFKEFYNYLEDFLNTVEYWQQQTLTPKPK